MISDPMPFERALGKSDALRQRYWTTPRADFLELLAKYEISFFPGSDELEADFAHA
jgi:hypothetical protein